MDQALLISGLTWFLGAAMLIVIVSDTLRYIIPNWLNLGILLAYVLAAVLLPSQPLWSVAAASLVLLFGLGSFSLGLMGGGDVKLLTVLVLWTGWTISTLSFLFLTAIAGGVLVVIVLMARVLIPPFLRRNHPEKPLPRILARKQPVPYGIAIALAFLWVMYLEAVRVHPHTPTRARRLGFVYAL
jgi:prepilin peptidase CpaA